MFPSPTTYSQRGYEILLLSDLTQRCMYNLLQQHAESLQSVLQSKALKDLYVLQVFRENDIPNQSLHVDNVLVPHIIYSRQLLDQLHVSLHQWSNHLPHLVDLLEEFLSILGYLDALVLHLHVKETLLVGSTGHISPHADQL